jgi:Domain of unknown function (DUF4157)
MPDRPYELSVERDRPAAPRAVEPTPSPPPREPALLALQRTHGNRYVQRVVEAGAEGGDVSASLERRIDEARPAGRPLEPALRGSMESAFGADFGAVRVHDGPQGHGLSEAVSARAFTTGSDVFFANGQYSPGSRSGRELIAHELTHVLQQGAGVQAKLWVTPAGDAQEREADDIARAVVQRETALPGTEL